MYSSKLVSLQLGPLVDMPLRQNRMRCKAGGFSTGATLIITFGTITPDSILLWIRDIVFCHSQSADHLVGGIECKISFLCAVSLHCW